MSGCCRAAPCEELFDARVAAWYLRRYQRGGLDGTERRMLAVLGAADLAGSSVLELGGGVGALQAELLKRGAAKGEVVELVAAYAPFAAELAAEAGVAERSTFRVADVLGDPGAAQPADIVIVNRVVCCSAEGVELLGAAARLTKGVLLVSFPRPSRLARLAARAQHGLARLFGRLYRFYVHPRARLRAAAEGAGLEPVGGGAGLVWEYVAFRRPTQPANAAPDISPT